MLGVVVDECILHGPFVLGAAVVHRLGQRDWHEGRLLDLLDLLHRHLHRLRELLVRGIASQLEHHLAFNLGHPGDDLEEVHGEADGSRLVRDGPRHRLPDPPVRVGAELVAALKVKLLRAANQTHASLLDEILEAHALVRVSFGD